MTKLRPIILRASEVRDLLEKGNATVVRPVKPEPLEGYSPYQMCEIHRRDKRTGGILMRGGEPVVMGWGACEDSGEFGYLCPFGAPGSELWVRETWSAWKPDKCYNAFIGSVPTDKEDWLPLYKATWLDDGCIGPGPGGWRSPVTMPRWASRLVVRVEDVRVEQIEDVWHWVAGLKRAI